MRTPLYKYYSEPGILAGTKPRVPVTIDWEHPLAEGLIHAFIFNETTGNVTNLVDGESYPLIIYGSTITDIESADEKLGTGINRIFSSIWSSIPVQGGIGTPYQPLNQSLSIYHLGSQTPNSYYNMILSLEASGGTGAVRFNVNNADKLRFLITGNAGTTTLDSITTCTPDVVRGHGCSALNTGTGIDMSVFIDGQLDNSVASANTNVDTRSNPCIIGYLNSSSAYVGDSYLQYYWLGRALTADEHRELHENPYALLKPIFQMTWIPTPADTVTYYSNTSLDVIKQKQNILLSNLDIALQKLYNNTIGVDSVIGLNVNSYTTIAAAVSKEYSVTASVAAAKSKVLTLDANVNAVLQINTYASSVFDSLQQKEVTFNSDFNSAIQKSLLNVTYVNPAVQKVFNVSTIVDVYTLALKNKTSVIDTALLAVKNIFVGLSAFIYGDWKKAIGMDSVWEPTTNIANTWNKNSDGSNTWNKNTDISGIWTEAPGVFNGWTLD